MSTAKWPQPAENMLRPRAKKRAPQARPRLEQRRVADEPAPADFLALEVRAVEGEKWPVSPVLWWQPELALTLPKTSGLRNERRHKTPGGGFLNLDLAPVLPAGVAAAPKLLMPSLPAITPESDLALASWDIRSSTGKGRE